MKKRSFVSLIAVVLIIAMLPVNAFAAGYDSISRKISGYGVSLSKTSDNPIYTSTASELVNTKSYAVSTSDTVTISRNISFSSGCDTSISGSIGVTDGAVSGKLGTEIKQHYDFSSGFQRTYTKSITVTVPAKSTYKLTATIKGDVVSVYYKHFFAWITTDKGSGTVYVPKYCSWTCK